MVESGKDRTRTKRNYKKTNKETETQKKGHKERGTKKITTQGYKGASKQNATPRTIVNSAWGNSHQGQKPQGIYPFPPRARQNSKTN